jgi:hypothetical protein
MRIDRNQTLTVTITPKGLFPFINDPLDPFCGTIAILLHGHSTALLDNRDGSPRPKDVGGMRDDLVGDATNEALNTITAEDVSSLTSMMDAATNCVETQEVADELTPAAEPPPEPPKKSNWLWWLLAAGAATQLGEGPFDDIYGSSLDIEEFQGSSTDNDPYSL